MSSLNTIIRKLSRDYPNPDEFAILSIMIISEYMESKSRHAKDIERGLTTAFRSTRSNLNNKWYEMPHQTTEKPEDIIKSYLEKTTQKSLTKSTSEKSPKSVKIYPKVRLYRSLTQHTSLKKPKLRKRKQSW